MVNFELQSGSQLLPVASSELIAQRMLQQRVDTKMMMPKAALPDLLAVLGDQYAVVLSSERQNARYSNLYFDTPDHQSLRDHHRGRRPRYKVRIRHHVDRSMSFLEVKQRLNSDATRKMRRPISFRSETLDDDAFAFIREHSPVLPENLRASMRIDFERVTLVGLDTPERVTFDADVCFATGADSSAEWHHGVIVEVKQARFKPRTPIMLALRKARAWPMSLSKYCTGAQLLLPAVKMNRYRPRLRFLRRRFND